MDQCQIGPYLYPIGYPLMISPLYYFGTPSYLAIKIFNYCIFLAGLYFLYRVLSQLGISLKLALLVTIMFSLAPFVISYHNVIGSDLPSATLAFFCMLRYLKLLNAGKWVSFECLFLSIILALAVFTRTANIVLLFAMCLTSAIRLLPGSKRIFFLHTLLLSAFTVAAFITNAYYPLSRNGNELKHVLTKDILLIGIDNIPYYASLALEPISSFFYHVLKDILMFLEYPFRESILDATSICIAVLMYLSFFVRALYKKTIRWNLNLLFIVLVCVGTLSFYCLWANQQGERFIFLIYPFLFAFLLTQSSLLKGTRRHMVMSFMMFVICSRGVIQFQFIISDFRNQIFDSESKPGSATFLTMMEYLKLKKLQEPQMLLGTFRPRIVYYHTGIPGYVLDTAYPCGKPQVNSERMDYVLLRKGYDDNLKQFFTNQTIKEKEIGSLVLYKVQKK